jgi:hypothetical protein
VNVVNSMKKSTVRSHYLPRTYLKHFLVNDELVMYMKGEKFFKDESKTPEQRIIKIKGEEGLKNVGLQNHLYNPNVEGLSSDELEEVFQKYGEDFYDITIAEIEDLPLGSKIPSKVKDNLSMFFASMRVRTPFFKKEIEDMDELFLKHMMSRKMEQTTPEDLIKEYKEIRGVEITVEMATKIHKSFIEKDYKLDYPNGIFIKSALSMLEEHADIFHQMTLNIYKSEEHRYFTTSDNPLTYFVPKEYVDFYNSPKSLVSNHSEVFFALTKNLGAHLSWRKESETIQKANRETVNGFNFNIPRHSLDYLFSPIEMNDMKDFVKNYYPYPFKLKIS